MGVRDITYRLVKIGISPVNVSQVRRVSLATTLGYLDQMIGQGRLRRSDVFFSISKDVRDKCVGTTERPADVSPDDFKVLRRYGDAAHALGDMYEDLRCIEMTVHTMVRDVLVRTFGRSESGWWRQGVPEAIRRSSQVRREEDAEPADSPFCYTDLLDLGRIIEANWSVFQLGLPERYRSNRKLLLDDLRRLNSIRRNVMHPVRGCVPSEDDFDFARRLRADLAPSTMDPAEEAELQRFRDLLATVQKGASDEGDA